MSRAHTRICFGEKLSSILYLLNDNYHDMSRNEMEQFIQMEMMDSRILWVRFYKVLHSMTGNY